MSCDICTRAQSSALLCSTCARSRLYQLRLNHADVLLEREYLGQQIETAVNEVGKQGQIRETNNVESNGTTKWACQCVSNEQVKSSARVKVLAGQIESLRSQIKDKQYDIAQRRIALARRRSDSESAVYQLSERETGILSGIRNNIKRTDHLWHSNHTKTAEARIFLCREAASLYGLRQKVRKRDDGLRETYTIGGVSILDLRELNGAPPDHISTSFSYIAHILVLISHYLSLKLPAEITLPHRNYPHATIYTPSASYLRELYSSTTSSPSRDHPTPSPTPRPLCIENSLPKLAKEDPGTYHLFIEGVTLLAWNVSWLCRSQGLNLWSDSWEDVCDVGKNLWQLLVAPPGQSSTMVRALASDVKRYQNSLKTTIQRTKSFPMIGHYSHGTAHSFLCASEGTHFIKIWKLPTPTKVVDRLKSTLLGEMASAEWELLEEKEWDDIPKGPAQTDPYQPAREPETVRDPRPGSLDMRGSAFRQDALDGPPGSTRSRGTSGWTKLRNR
ncbi:hypothetical protein BDV06DRAFT_224009 [Aspergillus oleicola]